MNKDALTVFVERMKKLGVEIELGGNYPWVYLDRVNGKRVVERFEGNHGFTVAFMPIKRDEKIKFTDIGEIMKVIKKYR